MSTPCLSRSKNNLPEIPTRVITKDGQFVDTSVDTWHFRAASDGGKALELDWPALPGDYAPYIVSLRTLRILRLYLAHRLSFSKGHTVRNDFETVRRFLRWMRARVESGHHPKLRHAPFDWEELDQTTFRLFLEHGLTTANKGNDFARLRDFYAWGAFVGRFPEFDTQVSLSLKEVRAQGNVKGAAVRFGDVIKGPLHPIEQRLVIDAVGSAAGDPEDRALIMLHLELGLNPQSVARMKTSDFMKYQVKVVEQGRSITRIRYQLAVPAVKKRADYRQTKTRPISSELGGLLEQLVKGKSDVRLFHWLDEEDPERDIARRMRRFSEQAELISPRTGAILRLGPRRFRYTLGTEAARDGASPAKIAEMLDHSDLQNVDVYVEASSYVIDQVGQRFDEVFAPMARSFRGKVVESHIEPAFPGVPAKVVPSTSLHLPVLPVDVGGIGMCGRDVRKDGLCRLAPPLTCYPCEFFAAFRDGPHAQVLETLEKVMEGSKESSDFRIPMQLEEVAAAARQLVAQIAADEKDHR
jgi:integrase